MINTNITTNQYNNRLPSNIQILPLNINTSNNNININSNSKKEKEKERKARLEFPVVVNQSNYYNSLNNQSNTMNFEEEMMNVPVIKENFNMINRIKSSIQPKKRLVSALGGDQRIANKNNQMNSNITSLLEENQKLKMEIQKNKIEISNFKKEITQLECEIDKKDKLIDEVSVSSNVVGYSSNMIGFGNMNLNTNSNLKLLETKMVNGMKKQYKDLKKEYNKKIEEIEELKRLLKTTKLNELSIENETLLSEMNKLKELYKISINENKNRIQLLKELEILQNNFTKQQFMIISLQDKSNLDMKEIGLMKGEIKKDKAILAERNKKISELKRSLKIQAEYTLKKDDFKSNHDFIDMKKEWEKKMSTVTKDMNYYKQVSDKMSSRVKDLEDEIKRIKDNKQVNLNLTNNFKGVVVDKGISGNNQNDDAETKINIYKTKLNELNTKILFLSKENKDLNQKLNKKEEDKENIAIAPIKTENNISYMNNTKLNLDCTNMSTNLLKKEDQIQNQIDINEIEKMEILEEDNFNEVIYILMKNFEANKVDSSVIESAFPEYEGKSKYEVVQMLSKSLVYLIKNKNQEDHRLICQVLLTFIKNKSDSIKAFKKEFLSIFESISLFTSEQKTDFQRRLKKILKSKKEELVKELIQIDKSMNENKENEDIEVDFDRLFKKENNNERVYRYITFVDLRRIFDKLNINLDAELVEYLIFYMKSSCKDENSSIYDLNYLSMIELLYIIDSKNDDYDENEIEDDEVNKSYEISAEEFDKIISSIIMKIRIYIKKKKSNIEDLFKEDVALVEEETTKERYYIIELKDFIDKLDNVMGLELKELEVYCLYTKLKFDEVENDLEAISYDKLLYEFENDTKNKECNIKSQIVSNKLNIEENLFEDKEKNSFLYSSGFKIVKASSKMEKISKLHEDNEEKKENNKKDVKNIGINDIRNNIKKYMTNNNISINDMKNKINNDYMKIERLNEELIRIGIIENDVFLIKNDFSKVFFEDRIDINKLFEYVNEENCNKKDENDKSNQINNEKNKNEDSFKVNINTTRNKDDINYKVNNDYEEFDDEKNVSSFDKELNDALMNLNDD